MDRYDRLLIVLVVLAIALWSLQACGSRPDLAQGQASTFAPRVLVGEGLYMWNLGVDRCYSNTANALACVPIFPTRTGTE